MKEYVIRMLDEEKELRVKCEKLEAFISNDDNKKMLPPEDFKLLCKQLVYMQAYHKTLVCRIEREKVELLK